MINPWSFAAHLVLLVSNLQMVTGCTNPSKITPIFWRRLQLLGQGGGFKLLFMVFYMYWERLCMPEPYWFSWAFISTIRIPLCLASACFAVCRIKTFVFFSPLSQATMLGYAWSFYNSKIQILVETHCIMFVSVYIIFWANCSWNCIRRAS